ncbi:Lipase EstA/Esterase EstB family-containing protein [Aphelenchoides besseyi]|nr:Lipase EstA/Esterase EstB family-containing protein [Aphelenchoides besseyi]
MIKTSSLVLFPLLIVELRSEFSYDFYNFIAKHHGEKYADYLELSELRGIGSFGGFQSHNFTVNHKPIIFVHGAQSYVNMFWNRTEFLRNHNYSSSELYATSYDDKYNVSCKNIKRIRSFIEIVSAYTRSAVDIFASSMGVPIARKAILGGRCVDTNEQLGKRLTSLVDTFVSSDGVGYGVEDCEAIARNFNDSRFMAFCDLQIGLQPKSAVMLELNNQSERYEGSRLFSIHSDNDEVIGQRCDLNNCSEIKNATMTFTKSTPAHVWLSFTEMELPFFLFTSNSTAEMSY